MKLLYMLVMLLSFVPAYGSEDKMDDAIKRSDPDQLHRILMPGFYIRSDEKKRYLLLAQEMTNRTFGDLHRYSFGEILRAINGSLKVTSAGLISYVMYSFYKDEVNFIIKDPSNKDVDYKFEAQTPQARYISYGVLTILGSYFLSKGLSDYSSVLAKTDRFVRHRNALAVEAIIQRLPALETAHNIIEKVEKI